MKIIDVYEQAQELFHRFKLKTKLDVKMAIKDIFVSRVRSFTGEKIPDDNEPLIIQYLLPKIIVESTSLQTIQEIEKFATADL